MIRKADTFTRVANDSAKAKALGGYFTQKKRTVAVVAWRFLVLASGCLVELGRRRRKGNKGRSHELSVQRK